MIEPPPVNGSAAALATGQKGRSEVLGPKRTRKAIATVSDDAATGNSSFSTDTAQVSHPVTSANARAIAASMSAGLTFRIEGASMSIPRVVVDLALQRFAQLFPLPMADFNRSAVADIWMNLLDDVEQAEFAAAVREVARALTRFPFPADVLQQVQLARNESEKA